MKRSMCTRSTRSSTKHMKRETHRQTSEMHVAITNRNIETVKMLVRKGEKLCTGDGLNCFIIALHSNSTVFIKSLLEMEPEGAKAKNTDGYTLLIHFAQDYEMVKYLIKLGADVSAQTPKWSPLTKALCEGWADKRIVEALLAAGANLQTTDQNGCTVLCHAFRNLHHEADLQLFLKHPAFKKYKFCCAVEFQPQCILLDRLGSNVPHLFDVIMSNYKDLEAAYYTRFWLNVKINKLSSPLVMNSICYLLNNSMIPLTRSLALVERMISLGFSVTHPYGLSPLTVLVTLGARESHTWFMRYAGWLNTNWGDCNWMQVNSDEFIEDTKINLQAAQSFIARGVHVQQKVLVFQNKIIQNMKNQLCVPDALWIAVISGKFLIVDYLISSSICPPLALLLAIPRLGRRQLEVWFPHLAKYGPLPLGTLAYSELRTLISTHACDYVKREFNRMHAGEPSLKAICRYRIRQLMGEVACKPGCSMDNLISTLDIPVTLQDYLRKHT